MKVAIVGATGMIGRRLTTALLANGDEVLAISRRGQTVADAPGVAWDPARAALDPDGARRRGCGRQPGGREHRQRPLDR